jgi:hypothetical protein
VDGAIRPNSFIVVSMLDDNGTAAALDLCRELLFFETQNARHRRRVLPGFKPVKANQRAPAMAGRWFRV